MSANDNDVDLNTPNTPINGETNMAKTRNDRTYLNCPYDDKDDAKALGAKWDPT